MKYRVALTKQTNCVFYAVTGRIVKDSFRLKEIINGVVAFNFDNKKNNKYYFNGELNFIVFNRNLIKLC